LATAPESPVTMATTKLIRSARNDAHRKGPGSAPDKPTDLELQVAQTLMDLQQNSDLKSMLRELHITGAKEVEVSGGKKCIILLVPVPQLRAYQKIHVRLVRELEKKYSGKHVVIVAERRILPKESPKSKIHQKQKRPRSRTLTAVHDAVLNDLVFPAEIVGKRTRVRVDGSQLMKVHLDRANQTAVDHKLDTFVSVYRSLTGKQVIFEFPDYTM
ncbi:hypothetical protein BOX15_Mlig026494g3, partial [Macrostomum lignano]